MRSLIITPVGNPLTFDPRFDKKNHWRYTNSDRNYDTLVVAYNDKFSPEEGTYEIGRAHV